MRYFSLYFAWMLLCTDTWLNVKYTYLLTLKDLAFCISQLRTWQQRVWTVTKTLTIKSRTAQGIELWLQQTWMLQAGTVRTSRRIAVQIQYCVWYMPWQFVTIHKNMKIDQFNSAFYQFLMLWKGSIANSLHQFF